ncbi:CCHC-type domain-containing protein [Abeliophyllum distichum]|uniref:CCHC-type domain-containing protein n=1 Tax=Abeliophyllum distichum TaxID=126358 RepID=A0ABD1Q5J6_9LAMI
MSETKEKTRRSKEEMKEPPKKQIAVKSTNDEGSSNTNMSDEELDDLVLLVKKWRGFQNNRTECPSKKKFTKKKALQATWDYSDEDDIEEDAVQEEIANMFFWLLRMRQGSMTVVEYQKKFVKLSKYAAVLIANEANMSRRFEGGLKREIRSTVTSIDLKDFGKLVEAELVTRSR